MAETENSDVMSLTVTLLSAYFANNTVPSSELPALVDGTRRALLGDGSLGKETPFKLAGEADAQTPTAALEVASIAETPPTPPEHKPAVSVEESLASPDQILSLIDGKPYKALKRHLSTHGLTPVEYRARYNLAADYPMVAPGYSAARREVALKLGLGGKRKGASAPALGTAAETTAAETTPANPPVEAVEPTISDKAPAKPARVRRTRPKAVEAVEAEPKPVTKKPKRKVSKAPPAKAAKADAALKSKRSRAPKAVGETTATAEAAPESAAAAE